jgi:hypothetical protein
MEKKGIKVTGRLAKADCKWYKSERECGKDDGYMKW